MARGKYSPTVSSAYMKDQKWWDKYSAGPDGVWNQYDPEGFDQYGYDKDDVDRAGNNDMDYLMTDDLDYEVNWAYEDALNDWTFDGVKPVSKAYAKES